MKQQIAQLFARLDKLSTRERVMVYVAAAAVVVFLADLLFLGSLTRQQAAFATTIATQRGEIERLDGELQALAAGLALDPEADARQRVGKLEQRVVALDRELQGAHRQLLAPDQMGALLEAVLRQNQQLRLLSIKTLPAVALLDSARFKPEDLPEWAGAKPADPSAAGDAAAPAKETDKPDDGLAKLARVLGQYNVYRHGVEISFSGGYREILDYIARLEALPYKLNWAALVLAGDSASGITATLTVTTLSLDKAWLKL